MSDYCIIKNGKYDIVLICLLFLIISAALFYGFYVDKPLCADGIHYFILLLKDRTFTDVSVSRVFANILYELPAVIALKMGVTDILKLKALFYLGIYIPYIVSFLVSIYALRTQNKYLIFFYFFSILAINLSSDFILVGEYHVLALLTWPIFFILLRNHELEFFDSLFLLILLLFFTDLYETSLILSAIFIVLALARIYLFSKTTETVVMLIAIFASAISIAVDIYFILFPRDPQNTKYFLFSFLEPFFNLDFIICFLFMILFGLYLIFKKSFYAYLIILIVIIYLFVNMLFNITPDPHISYGCRTLTGTLLPILLVLATIFSLFNFRFKTVHISLFMIFTVSVVCGNINSSRNWNNFKELFSRELNSHTGIFNIKSTNIEKSKYQWGWNNTELGLIWSYRDVKSIAVDSETNMEWKEYRPLSKRFLDKYFHYNAAIKESSK